MLIETISATFIGAIAGGTVASIVSYYLTRRASSVEATYEVIHHILSDGFSNKRRIAREGLHKWKPAIIAMAKKEKDPAHQARDCIISILNYYDVIFSGVSDHMLISQTLKASIWVVIRDDHLFFESFIVEHGKANPNEQRPMFPNLRKYRDKWG